MLNYLVKTKRRKKRSGRSIRRKSKRNMPPKLTTTTKGKLFIISFLTGDMIFFKFLKKDSSFLSVTHSIKVGATLLPEVSN